MKIREFRGVDSVDREKEIEYIKSYVNQVPSEILWIYGPKSTGKNTLIEYIIENELTNGLKIFDKYWIKGEYRDRSIIHICRFNPIFF